MMEITKEGKNIILDKKRHLDDFGKLLNEQWLIKKSLTSKISNNYIDEIYETAIRAGAKGGKLLGAGGGGFMIFYVNKEYQTKVKQKLKEKLFVTFKFEKTGSKIIYNSRDKF